MMILVAAISGAHLTLRSGVSSRIGDNAGRGLKVRALQAAAAVLAACSLALLSAALAALRLWMSALIMVRRERRAPDGLADVCGRVKGSMLWQDALFNAATAALMLTISELISEETMEAMMCDQRPAAAAWTAAEVEVAAQGHFPTAT
jgi:hypothetical protein